MEKYFEEIIKVLGVLDSHPGTVCAVLSGHDHEGGIVFCWGGSGAISNVLRSEIVFFWEKRSYPNISKIATKVAV